MNLSSEDNDETISQFCVPNPMAKMIGSNQVEIVKQTFLANKWKNLLDLPLGINISSKYGLESESWKCIPSKPCQRGDFPFPSPHRSWPFFAAPEFLYD